MALAIVLGANVGTALVAQILSIDLRFLSPLLILAGVVTFMSGEAGRRRAIGRALVGLGLMLLSLKMLVITTAPVRDSFILHLVFTSLAQAHVFGMICGALLTMVTSSSLAVVLLVASLGGTLEPQVTVSLVLGANLGHTVLPLLTGSADGSAARRIPLGNAIMSLIGCVVAAPFINMIASGMIALGASPARLAVDVHLAFNVALAVVFLPLVQLIGPWIDSWLPKSAAADTGPRYLDDSCLETPTVALACAARETLRVGDRVGAMLTTSLQALDREDAKLVAELGRMDDEVDRLQEAIKLYLSRLGREGLDDADGRRSTEIISFAINLEHIGDIIDKSLRELIAKKIKNHLTFSGEGREEIAGLYARTSENLRIAQSIFMSRDVKLARKLMQEKVEVRRVEQRSAEQHLERLREGRVESLQTSTLHLDIMRDLKRINAHIVSVGYPILEASGELRESRLRVAAE
jgi:phosphate:Na+ symporter